MLMLSARDIRACFTMGDAIDAAEEALAAVSAGAARTPLRTVVPAPGADGSLISMPGHVAAPGGGAGALGVKVLGSFEGNLACGLPVTSAVMVVLDAETGVPQAVLDGTYLTRLRTGAASGAATRLLARADARVGALVGAGGQAACQLEAMLAARRLDEVRIFDVRPGAPCPAPPALARPFRPQGAPRARGIGRKRRASEGRGRPAADAAHPGRQCPVGTRRPAGRS